MRMTSTLTYDGLMRDVVRISRELGPPVARLRVQPSHYWPRVEDGTETLRFEAHPFIKWLARWLPITPYIEMEVTKYRDADPMHDTRNGILYCSHAQADALRRAGA